MRLAAVGGKQVKAEFEGIGEAGKRGFGNPNMIAMIKNGSTKLALDRVPSMARALECDSAYLLRLTLEQQEGDTAAQAIVEIFGTPVTANELGWLQEIRDASDNGDPRMTGRSRAAIRAIFGTSASTDSTIRRNRSSMGGWQSAAAHLVCPSHGTRSFHSVPW